MQIGYYTTPKLTILMELPQSRQQTPCCTRKAMKASRFSAIRQYKVRIIRLMFTFKLALRVGKIDQILRYHWPHVRLKFPPLSRVWSASLFRGRSAGSFPEQRLVIEPTILSAWDSRKENCALYFKP